jgi:putative glycosyltransferase (TIGR04348 family)
VGGIAIITTSSIDIQVKQETVPGNPAHINVHLITPAAPGSRAGNRATATRWANRLRELGCRVRIFGSADRPGKSGKSPDLVLTLHAWRSHQAIRAWRSAFPDRPLILVLTGTDIYRFQFSHPDITLESLQAADALIGLHDCVHDDIPARFHSRLHIVHQSAEPLPSRAPAPGVRQFEVLVAGHLREEKDSLRSAYAARNLPTDSRLRVIQLGGAHSEAWAEAARAEMQRNPRYRWLGERPRWQVRRWMSRSRLMVISSRMEGGANVVSEACVAGLPILASDIPGNRGLLGEDYAGYFPVADTEALRARLLRAEAEPAFLETLRRQVCARAPLFQPGAERQGLARAIAACGIVL